jgi:uncharacterized protein YbjT (DUF2867 family)
MRAVIIGGTGHIGTYLVPRLVSLGYEVINVSRSKRGPYDQHRAWKEVTQAQMDRRPKKIPEASVNGFALCSPIS